MLIYHKDLHYLTSRSGSLQGLTLCTACVQMAVSEKEASSQDQAQLNQQHGRVACKPRNLG